MWRRQPDGYLNPGLTASSRCSCTGSPASDLVDARDRAPAAMPANIEDGSATSPELVPPIYLERAVGQARAGARYVREILPARSTTAARAPTPGRRGRGRRHGVEDRGIPRGLLPRQRRLAIGEERYRAAAREGAARLRRARAARARPAAYDRLADELTRCARELPAPTTGWRCSTGSTRTTRPRRRRCARVRGLDRARRQFLREPAGHASRRARSAASSRRRPSSGRCSPSRRTAPAAVQRRCTATSSCRSRPTARPRRRSSSGWRATPTRASRRPRCTRPTPATTGTW